MNRMRMVFLNLACLAAILPGVGSMLYAAGFGSTKATIFTFKGDIYNLSPADTSLPDLDLMTPVGTIYADSLNVPPQSFLSGFPGVTDRIEWFAIDYNGYFYVSDPNRYDFRLTSDDGSKLYIDDELIINNDGLHSATSKVGAIELTRGVHHIRVQYFQGPREHIALILEISHKGKWGYDIFKISDYLPAIVTSGENTTQISMNGELLFDFNKSDLNKEAKLVLDQVKKYHLDTGNYRTVIIEGHSDDIGTDAQNMSISLKRALAVKNYLCRAGMKSNRIQVKGYGKTKPKVPNTSDKNRATNRRIEIVIIK